VTRTVVTVSESSATRTRLISPIWASGVLPYDIVDGQIFAEQDGISRLGGIEVTGAPVKWNYLLTAVMKRQLWGK
jgi:hypothetical protein